jgi:hypothetical protein
LQRSFLAWAALAHTKPGGRCTARRPLAERDVPARDAGAGAVQVAAQIAKSLGEDFDIEIVEGCALGSEGGAREERRRSEGREPHESEARGEARSC